ncbi:sporulation histidine kinase inhibitor Sda [Paenibacillus eucommiae]|nr:sporulation histidine kinase inhibitor Sda [Paenibacillus eucommiae]
MKVMSDEALIESYYQAVELQLEIDFIDLLLAEIQRRKLNLVIQEKSKAHLH